jgi:hypothetical protein
MSSKDKKHCHQNDDGNYIKLKKICTYGKYVDMMMYLISGKKRGCTPLMHRRPGVLMKNMILDINIELTRVVHISPQNSRNQLSHDDLSMWYLLVVLKNSLLV